MMEQTNEIVDDEFFSRRPETKTQEERDKDLKAMIQQVVGFADWDDEQEEKEQVVKPTKLQQKLNEDPVFVDKRFQRAIEARKTSDYIMNNVATSSNAAYLEIVNFEDKVEEKSETQKKRERRAGSCKSSYVYDLKGKKIEPKMEDKKNKILSEGEASRRSLNPRVEQTTQTEVSSVLSETSTQTSMQLEQAVSVTLNLESVDLVVPYQNMPTEKKVEINAIFTKQFEDCGFQQLGWTPLFGVNGEAWYSVSFKQGDRIPDFADAEEVNQLLASLNFKNTIAWGLRRIQPFIVVSSTTLDRWQITLEVLSDNELHRELQMAKYTLCEIKPKVITPLPSLSESESESEKKESKQPEKKKLTLRQKMRIMFDADPEAIVESAKYGKITVAEWFKLQYMQRKEKKKVKKLSPKVEEEILRLEGKTDEPEQEEVKLLTLKSSFSDDSIPKEVQGPLKMKLDHRKEIKQNPDKVLGQRKWVQGKGVVKNNNFATVLQNDLEPSKHVIVFRPLPIEPLSVAKKKIPKCPIPGLPQGKWRGERLDHRTEDELNEIAKQLLRRMIRSEVRYLRGRWLGSKIRERNTYLVKPEDIIAVVESNPKETQWESFKDWQTAAKEVKPIKGTPAQMNWSVYVPRLVDSDSEKN